MNSHSWPLLRDAGRLLWLENRPLPSRGKRRRGPGVDSSWRLRRVDIERVPAGPAHSGLAPVREAWARLAHASRDAETLAALVLVLCASSHTGARCARPLPALRGADVRPWLGDGAAVADLVRDLGGFLSCSRRLLAHHRWLPIEELGRTPARLADIDLFVLTRCGERVNRADVKALPLLSRELLALAPQGRRWTESGPAATMIDALDLDATDDGLGLAARVWTLSGCAWLREVAACECADRVAVLRLLVDTGAAATPPPADMRRVFMALRHHGSGKRRLKDLRWIIKGLKRGASPGYLAGALRVAAKCIEGGDVHELDEAPRTAWSMRTHVMLKLAGSMSSFWLRRVWRSCSQVPGLVHAMGLLRSVERLPAGAVRGLAATVARLPGGGDDRQPLPAGDLERLVSTLLSTVHRLGPARASDWIPALERLCAAGKPFSVRACDQAVALSVRLEGLVHEAAGDVASLLGSMIRVKGEALLGAAPAPSDDWCRRIAECTASWTRRDRACDGIEQLDARAFDMLWSACLAHPARWFRLMEEIACVPEARVRAVFQSAAEHPLFACALRPDDLRRGIALIDSVREERCSSNPVSLRLRHHAAADDALPPHLFRHDIASLRRGWLEAHLHLVDELVQAEIWRAFPGLARESGVTAHTVKLALTVDSNDRPLRRLIRRCASGDHDWIARHPINQRWRSQFGEPRAARWCDGIAAVRVLPKLGEVIVAPEHDPQEVLRMGTAVRSCLSLGSCNAFAAAANALDANKLVVCATTPAGSMVGRQLLAISEENRLVCFSPYPRRLATAVLEFFEDYDQVLSSYLGIPLHRTGEYTIKPLVAKEWYDDGLWDRVEWVA